jgi:hypothetical protein
MPGARCYRLALGTEDKANLAYLEVDVPHVLHAPSYLDYLHESFHLVLDALVQRDKERDPLAKTLADRASDPLLVERVSEIFAFSLCRLFVFGNDVKAFIQSHLAAFDRGYTVDGMFDFTRIVRTSELLLRLFLAFDALEDAPVGGDIAAEPRAPRPELAMSFGQFFSLARPLLRERDRLWNGPDSPGREYCWNLVQAFYPEAARWMRWLSQMAFSVYRSFREDVKGTKEPYAAGLCEEVREAISDGWPLSSYLQPNGKLIDPMVLICRVLQAHLGRITSAENRSVHLRRKPDNLAVDYSLAPDEPSWFDFQLDPGVSTMFCPVPKARQQRLRAHIAMFKTFWNVASVLRGRRLEIILKENWSPQERQSQG